MWAFGEYSTFYIFTLRGAATRCPNLTIFQGQRELYHHTETDIIVSEGPGGASVDVSQLEMTLRAVLIPSQHSYRPLFSEEYSVPTAAF
jgi:hypothetical protein